MVSDHSIELSDTKLVLEQIFKVHDTSLDDRRTVKRVCELVGTRAARLSAAGVAAIVTKMNRLNGCTVAIDGSLFEVQITFLFFNLSITHTLVIVCEMRLLKSLESRLRILFLHKREMEVDKVQLLLQLLLAKNEKFNKNQIFDTFYFLISSRLRSIERTHFSQFINCNNSFQIRN